MKYNLLKMVQLILSSMDSDEVNSISDTTESLQIVDIIESTYNDLVSTLDFPDQWDLFELEATTVSTPTVMTTPADVARIEYIKYDVRPDASTIREFTDVLPMDRKQFFDRMDGLDTADSTVYSSTLTVGTGTFELRGHNNRHPMYYTSIDDHTLIFDSYDSSVDSTLQGNKTWCYGMKIPTFTRADDFTPDLEPRHFTLLFNEAKSLAFSDLKQVTNQKAEQRARRGWVHKSRKNPQNPAGSIYSETTPDFGRK